MYTLKLRCKCPEILNNTGYVGLALCKMKLGFMNYSPNPLLIDWCKLKWISILKVLLKIAYVTVKSCIHLFSKYKYLTNYRAIQQTYIRPKIKMNYSNLAWYLWITI
jgi:hypothetical protein